MWAMSAMRLALGVLASATQTTFLPNVVSRRTMVRGQRVVITKPTSLLLIFERHT